MPLELVTIPCLDDNYAFLLHDGATGQTVLVDIPEAEPISAELAKRGWKLSQVWITHHHGDHIQGLPDLADYLPARATCLTREGGWSAAAERILFEHALN